MDFLRSDDANVCVVRPACPYGFRLYERNRFGVDSRDVLIRGDRVVVRNVVHQRYVR